MKFKSNKAWNSSDKGQQTFTFGLSEAVEMDGIEKFLRWGKATVFVKCPCEMANEWSRGWFVDSVWQSWGQNQEGLHKIMFNCDSHPKPQRSSACLC